MVLGYLKEITSHREKQGDRSFSSAQCCNLNSFMDSDEWLTGVLMEIPLPSRMLEKELH